MVALLIESSKGFVPLKARCALKTARLGDPNQDGSRAGRRCAVPAEGIGSESRRGKEEVRGGGQRDEAGRATGSRPAAPRRLLKVGAWEE
eukprot:1176886-Prorocentrum_minimum.AAC.1